MGGVSYRCLVLGIYQWTYGGTPRGLRVDANIWCLWSQLLVPKHPLWNSITQCLHWHCIASSFLAMLFHCPLYTVMKQKNKKGESFINAVSHFTPLAIATMSVYAWVYSPHSLIKQSPLLFSIIIGIVFAKTATKVILAHLTHQPYPTYSRLMAPLVLGAFLSRFDLFTSTTFTPKTIFSSGLSEYEFLLLYFSCVLVAYCVWAWHVVEAFCVFLGIKCFSLKKTENGE